MPKPMRYKNSLFCPYCKAHTEQVAGKGRSQNFTAEESQEAEQREQIRKKQTWLVYTRGEDKGATVTRLESEKWPVGFNNPRPATKAEITSEKERRKNREEERRTTSRIL